MFGSVRNLLGFGKPAVQMPESVPVVEHVLVSREVMDAAFDRSAGRFCAVCDAHGSHHTEKHDEFATAALTGNGFPIFPGSIITLEVKGSSHAVVRDRGYVVKEFTGPLAVARATVYAREHALPYEP